MRNSLLVAAVALAGVSSVIPASGQALSLGNYQLVSETRLSRTDSEYAYRATLTNAGPALTNVTATAVSTVPNAVIVDGLLTFGIIGGNTTKPSTDTFTIRVNRSVPFSFENLTWTFSSTPVTVTPIANAGTGQTVPVDTTVALNGSASSDPSGNPLTYLWAFLSKPATSTAAIVSPTSVTPSFTADKPGEYLVQLTVSNGTASASATVTISTTNTRPVANAGPNQSAPVQATITLNGSLSFDIDGNPLTYNWQLTSRPASSTAVLANPTSVNPTFVVDQAGSYTAQLIVNDGFSASLPDSVTISTVNTPPVAKAGVDQSVISGALVNLNGSNSSDIDGNPLTYQWSLTSKPANSAAALSNPSSVAPTFTADLPGIYVAQLIVNDGIANSAPDTVVIATNAPVPIANAGEGQSVKVTQTVTLNGSASSDASGLPLTYQWSLTTRPTGSLAVLLNPTAVMPTFVADRAGTYVAQLIVNNGFLNSTPSTVTITTGNTAPVANAGIDQAVNVTAIVQLTGAASSDVDGNPLTYSWSLTSRPTGSSAVLSSSTAVNPTFTADQPGTYVAQLVVNDGIANSAADTVTIRTNTLSPPVADAGVGQSVPLEALVSLDGLGSRDPQGFFLSYRWSLTTRPATSVAAISNPTLAAPTFTADKAGTYVAQLIVNNGFLDSAPDTVIITTMNNVPEANAGPDQNVATGATVLLNGALSSDPDFNPLTYQWSLLSKPATSAAALSGATSVNPSFLADLAGTYVAQLIVNDGIVNSAPNTVTITAASSKTITLSPAVVNLQTYASTSLTVTLSAPAGVGGQSISLSSSSASVTVPSSVVVPASASSVNVQITAGVAAGSATITAAAATYTSGAAAVTVDNRDLSLTLSSALVGVSRSVEATVTLADPAPAGGITITLASTPASLVTIAPSTVNIAAGATVASFTVTGANGGNATLSASAPGYGPDAAQLNVTASTINLPSNVSTGPGQSVAFPISLATAAPAGGVTVTLTSANTAIATITSSAFIAAGATTPSTQPQLNGVGFGQVQISATAPNYAPDSRTARVLLSLNFSPLSSTVLVDNTRTLILDLSAPAPTGGLTINLSSDNTSFATVPATVNFPAGSVSANVVVTGVAVGSTTIRASATNVSEASASITVNPAPEITLFAQTIGKDLQTSTSASLAAPAPAGNLQVTLTSSDPSKLRLSTSPSTAGSTSITVSVLAGQSATPAFYLQGWSNSGTAQYIATASGYANGTATVSLVPSGFTATNVCNPSGGCADASPFAVPSGSGKIISVGAYALNSSLSLAAVQSVRGGLTVNVPVTSSSPSVGTISTSPLVFVGEENNKSTTFSAVSAGNTNIIIGVPSGFSAPVNENGASRQIAATVTAADLTFPAVTVGKDLEVLSYVNLASPAPEGGTSVTITSSDPTRVILAATAETSGATSVTVLVPQGSQSAGVYVQGLTASGSSQLTFSASGFGSGSGTVTLGPSGFSGYVCFPSFCQGGSAFETTVLSANNTIAIYGFLLDSSANIVTNQPLRGGFSVSVPVTSSAPGVGTITVSPVIVTGNGTALTEFDPASAGTTTITVGVPTGFSAPLANASYSRQITATVIAPGITFSEITVGKDLQTAASISLAAPAPTGGTTVTVTSGDPTRLLVAPDPTTVGTAATSILIPEGTQFTQVYVQGLAATGTAQVTLSAPGFGSSTGTVTLAPSGFVGLVCPSNSGCQYASPFTTTTLSPNTSLIVYSAQLNSELNVASFQQVRPGVNVSIPVTSSNTSVGTITISPLTASATSPDPTTEFNPALIGTTTLTIGVPSGFSTPFENGSYTRIFVATVTAPAFTISEATVGKDLQTLIQIYLDAPAPVGGLVVTLVSSNAARVLLSADGTTAGLSSASVTVPEGQQSAQLYVQGLTATGTAQITASAPGFSNLNSTVTLAPSGFVIFPVDNFTTSVSATNTSIAVYSARLDSNLLVSSYQEVRGGLTVSVPVTSSNPSVGTISTSPLIFTGGSSAQTTEFDPATVGTTVLSAGVPAGFSSPSNYRQTTAVVQ